MNKYIKKLETCKQDIDKLFTESCRPTDNLINEYIAKHFDNKTDIREYVFDLLMDIYGRENKL